MKITYKDISNDDINFELFEKYKRYQEVKQCWRKIDGKWVLKDISFIEDWNDKDKLYLVNCLKNTINQKGSVIGAFDNNLLVGFSSIENNFFGQNKEYLQLSSLHTSKEYRGHGIGKQLFILSIQKAKKRGAKKLYISAHSSKETQAFYKSVGCGDTLEINKTLYDKEPYDCHLEYVIV